MRFLFFTDSHIRTKTPIRRTGAFENDIMEKLIYILLMAQEWRVQAIIFGGDLFDLPNPSFRLAARVLNLIQSSKIPWFHVLGNHDILGRNPDSYDFGILAFFQHLSNFEIMGEHDFDQCTIKAVHYRHGVEEMTNEWLVPNSNTILCAHAMVTPKPVPFLHALAPNLDTDARIVLLGHYHDPWANVVLRDKISDPFKKLLTNGLSKLLVSKEPFTLLFDREEAEKVTLFINPGSLARVAALAHNLRRTPRALCIDITESEISITSIPIVVARPADKIFKTEEIAEEKGWESRIEEFLAAMENVKVEGIEAATLVVNAAKARAGVDVIDDLPGDQRKVLDYALGMIERIETRGGYRVGNE